MNLAPKVQTSGLSMALVVIIVWALHQFAHLELPPEVSAALAALIGFGAGYLQPQGDWQPKP